MDLSEIVDRLRVEHAELLAGFGASPEYLRLPPHREALVWSAALLEAMQGCELGWAEVDLYMLRGLLYGAMSWVIDAVPDDPAAVAGELAALVRYLAGREEIAEAPACLAYLGSARAAADIAAWVAPVPERLAHVGGTG
jgi:hypothetical protein